MIEQYRLADDEYELVIKSDSGTLRRSALPGLEIPVNAAFDRPEFRATLRRIVESAAGAEM